MNMVEIEEQKWDTILFSVYTKTHKQIKFDVLGLFCDWLFSQIRLFQASKSAITNSYCIKVSLTSF